VVGIFWPQIQALAQELVRRGGILGCEAKAFLVNEFRSPGTEAGVCFSVNLTLAVSFRRLAAGNESSLPPYPAPKRGTPGTAGAQILMPGFSQAGK